MKISSQAVLFLTVSSIAGAGAWEDTCTQFKDIYASGTELCEKMWDDSFEVVDDESMGYTMWFFDPENNPNDDVTTKLFGEDSQPEQCHLQYFHKDTPTAEDDSMTECHPWKNRACCDSETVKGPQELNEAYGEGYEWDRCGPMTEACERYFVMEACLYECEPAAGLFRKYNESQKDDPDFNEWQLHKMPIKKSFCDAWYNACYNDYFCGEGSFFGCDAYYWEELKKQEAEDAAKKDKGLVIGLSIAAGIAAVGLLFSYVLIKREKSGSPIFTPAASAEGVQT